MGDTIVADFIQTKIKIIRARLQATPRYLRYSVLTFLCGSLIAMQIFVSFGDNSGIDQRVVLPFLFNVREHISPRKIDPRIKIFALDDQSYGYLKGDDIPLSDWAKIFQEIGKIPNVKVIVDKLFSKYYSDEEISDFRSIMNSAKPNVSIISYTHPDNIRFRDVIPSRIVEKNTKNLIQLSTDFVPKMGTSHQAYGATERVIEAFSQFGHAEYSGTGRILAARPIDQKSLIPFASLTLGENIKAYNHKILVNGSNIHVNQDGEFVVNFAPRAAFSKNSFAFMSVVARVKKGLDLSVIKPGDVVVILPAMYTGNTDFKSTPFGNMPGGLILAAVADSVLTGRWLNYLHDPGFFVVFLGIAVFLTTSLIRPWVAAVFTFCLSGCLLLTSILVFVLFDTIAPYVFPIIAIAIAGASGVTVTAAANEAEERRIKREVEVATLVQKSFLRNGTSNLGDSIIATGNSQPASECGGDWWGAFHKHGYNYILIGDAVGHGVPAALVTAVAFSVTKMIHEELGVSMPPSIDPVGILKRINTILCEMGNESAFMPFQVMRVNDVTGECLYANAGNLHPVLIPFQAADERLAKDQRVKTLVAPGEPLGSSVDVEYLNHKITLRPGDHILMYTDGIIENQAAASKAPVGRAWLKKTLQSIGERKGSGLHDEIWDAYQNRIGKLAPIDDATLVTFYRRPSISNSGELMFEAEDKEPKF